MWPFVDQSNFVVAEITFNDVMTALVVKITSLKMLGIVQMKG